MRVGVVGAGGRMGREVCRTVLSRPGLELVAAIDPGVPGVTIAELTGLAGPDASTVTVATGLDALAASGTEVVVDFTHLEASRATIAYCAAEGMHVVVGTTGFDQADLDELAALFPAAGGSGANCIVAANFAIGAVLMMRFAAMAAPNCTTMASGTPRRARRCARPRGWLRHGPTPVVTGSPQMPRRPWSWRERVAARARAAYGCTPCAYPDWWPTRRSCSARQARG